jgi:hypothetical protein
VLPIKGFIKIFDFRKGEDFNQQVGWNQRFSSLIGDFIVVDVYPGFNFFRKQRNALLHDAQLRLDDLVRLAIERAPVGFVAVSGGPTESERVIRENVSEFTKQADASLFGYFAPEDAAKQLRLRREQIAYQTWLVGGCGSKFDQREEIKWDFGAILSVPGLQCLSMMVGETDESICVTRWWDGLDDYIQAFDDIRATVDGSSAR